MFDSVKGMFRLQSKPISSVRPVHTERARVVNSYHAVSIKPGPRCCQTAKTMSGVRFLSKQAPRLPLPQCDAASCECKYVHHEDRRSDDRRASDGGPVKPGAPYSGPNRRKSKRDRRIPAEASA